MWTTTPTYATTDLHQIKANTLIINGDREDTVLEHVLELYDGISNSQLFVVPGVVSNKKSEMDSSTKVLNLPIIE